MIAGVTHSIHDLNVMHKVTVTRKRHHDMFASICTAVLLSAMHEKNSIRFKEAPQVLLLPDCATAGKVGH